MHANEKRGERTPDSVRGSDDVLEAVFDLGVEPIVLVPGPEARLGATDVENDSGLRLPGIGEFIVAQETDDPAVLETLPETDRKGGHVQALSKEGARNANTGFEAAP